MAEFSRALQLTARCPHHCGPTLMAECFKELPQTARCLLPLPGEEAQPEHMIKLGLIGGFLSGWVLCLPPLD